MTTPARTSPSAPALAAAAAVAFLGSLLMLDAGRVLLGAGSQAPAGRPGALLLTVVILLALTGVLLLGLAAEDVLRHRRPHPARAAPRRHR